MKLWSVTKRIEIATLKGHKAGVNTVAFSPDGKMLASAASYADAAIVKPGEIKFWLVANKSEIGSLKGHPAIIMSPAKSNYGQLQIKKKSLL